ncbi:MAG: SurA N-terminal domain-containing protein [Magnetococcales bacterium]|nr:SurA N-terminal domain-containing protein [Magnetococcales bacterium]
MPIMSSLRRSSKTWVVKGLLFLLGMTFVVWGVGGYLDQKANEPVVRVNEFAVSQQEFARLYDADFDRLRQMTNGQIDKKMAEALGLKQQVLSNLINRYLLLSVTRQLGMSVPLSYLQQRISGEVIFHSKGRFDPERYQQVLRQSHLTAQEYESGLTSDLAVDQLRRLANVVVATPQLLLENNYLMEQEQRRADRISLDPTALLAAIQVNDEQLEQFRSSHSTQFMTPVRFKVRYVLLDAASMRQGVSVSDAEMEEYYTEHEDSYRRRESRHVRHILARSEEKLKQIQSRLAAGESFESVAKTASEDTTAAQGGDLGWLSTGVMVPEFDQAAFALPKGEVSQPVKSSYGYHLIRIDDIRPAETTPLAQVREEIRQTLLEQKAQEAVYNHSIKLEDRLAGGGDLASIAHDFQLKEQSSDWLSDQQGQEEAAAVEQSPKFLEMARTTAVGQMSPLFELPNNRFVALQVVERQEARLPELAEIRDRVTSSFKMDAAQRQARTLLEEAVKALQQNQPWQQVVTMHPAFQADQTPLLRDGSHPDGTGDVTMNPEMMRLLFKLTLEKPLHPTPINDGTRLVLLRLATIQKADVAAMTEPQRRELSQRLAITQGEEQSAAWLQTWRKQAKIEFNSQLLEHL